jgi:MFS family permease
MVVSLFTIAVFVASLTIGLIPALIDGIRKPMAERMNASATAIDWCVRLFYFTWLIAMPAAGYSLDAWPVYSKELLYFSQVGVIVALTWLGVVRSLAPTALFIALLAIAYSWVATSAFRLMALAYFANASPYASLNVGFVAVGLGALVGMWIARAIEHWGGYRQSLLAVSVGLIAPPALVALCDHTDFTSRQAIVVSWEDVLVHPQLALVVGLILVYFAVENCLEFWQESYLKELGYLEAVIDLRTADSSC